VCRSCGGGRSTPGWIVFRSAFEEISPETLLDRLNGPRAGRGVSGSLSRRDESEPTGYDGWVRRSRFELAVGLVIGGIALAGGCHRERAPEPGPRRAVVVLAPGVRPVWRRGLGALLAALESRLRLSASATTVGDGARLEDALLEEARANGVELVVCLGPECDGAVFTVAPVEPTVRFVVAPGERGERNVAGVMFAEGEAAYIAGAVAGVLGDRPELVLVEGPRCPPELRDALEHGLRSRARQARVRAVPRASALAGGVSVDGESAVVLCPGPDNRELAADLGRSGCLVVVFDPEVVDGLEGLDCAVISENLPEAVCRVAEDILERDMAGKAYLFDVGSGVVGFRFCQGTAERLPAAAVSAAREARDEVTAGIAEIEVLDLHR